MSKRQDAVGFFWQDVDKRITKKQDFLIEAGWECIRTRWYKRKRRSPGEFEEAALELDVAYKLERKTAEHCEPPEPVWELPTYLPHLDLARSWNYDILNGNELLFIAEHKIPLVMDIECYRNYWLIAFREHNTGKCIYFDMTNDSVFDVAYLTWIMEHCLIVTFNGNNYDMPIVQLALGGCSNAQLKQATDDIIVYKMRTRQILKDYSHYKWKKKPNHIDIKEIPAGAGSLKIYGGRVGTGTMQDLPFKPEVTLSEPQICITRWYCINDLITTFDLYNALSKQRKLRDEMSVTYKQDLRSKSEAQIAEAVIVSKYREITGEYPRPAKIDPGTTYKYNIPDYMQFQTPYLQSVLQEVRDSDFVVAEDGKIKLPEKLSKLKIKIADTVYKLGIGGIHSTEKRVSHYSDELYSIEDEDVESYYPRIILNQQLSPTNMGAIFLRIYNDIVETRLAAKHAGNKAVSDQLKIVINGSFGKFGSVYSSLYAPQLLIQTTLSGQLSLLMLIEAFETRGISVVSANTDGIVIRKPRARMEEIQQLVKAWERHCGFKMEATPYKSVHSMAVNDYLAVKMDGGMKVKGKMGYAGVTKNPNVEVCIDAVTDYLTKNIPIETTINNCTDVLKFLKIQKVAGGAVKDGEYLGGAIRWYYSKDNDGFIIYAKNGKKVGRSLGAKPLMTLPDKLMDDIDYDWYINECYDILYNCGVLQEKAA